MVMTANTLVERFFQFTQVSLKWCIEESEDSTSHVADAISHILRDTNRVCRLSEESIKAIETLHTRIKDHIADGNINLDQLVTTLKSLAKEHQEINNVINPIIESLQFQDRLRQNLENLAKMIPYWLEFRLKNQNGIITNQDLLDFGNSLLKKTAMAEEREIIRSFIPGLPEDDQKESVMMF